MGKRRQNEALNSSEKEGSDPQASDKKRGRIVRSAKERKGKRGTKDVVSGPGVFAVNPLRIAPSSLEVRKAAVVEETEVDYEST